MILSIEHLPRDLKIIGSISIALSLFAVIPLLLQSFQGGGLLDLLIFLSPLLTGVVYFSLASGVSKKEKWVWKYGIVFFGLIVTYNLLAVLLQLISPLFVVVGSLIPALFLFSFIKGARVDVINTNVSRVSFAIATIGILMTIISLAALVYNQVFFSRQLNLSETEAIKEVAKALPLSVETTQLATIPEDYEVKKTLISPNGRRTLSILEKDESSFIFLDGIKSIEYEKVDGCKFSNNSRHFACIVVKSGRWFANVDGELGKPYDSGFRNPVFSPDGERLAYVMTRGGKRFVILDGKESRGYDSASGLLFSDNSKHFAYSAKGGSFKTGRYIVLDGEEQESRLSIQGYTFSSDGSSFAYVATRSGAGGTFVVVDGEEQGDYKFISKLTFSPDGSRFAYKATKLNAQFHEDDVVVLDGEEGRSYDGVGAGGDLVFSPDSKHFVYAATIDKREGSPFMGIHGAIVIDGKEKEYSGFVKNPVFSPDSNRIAYAVRTRKPLNPEEWSIVVDDVMGESHGKISDVVFSPDSQHVAFRALKDDETFVVLDGQEGMKYETGAYTKYPFNAELIFSSDSKHLAYTFIEGSKTFAILNGEEGEKYDEFITIPIFSSDGKYLAYGVKSGNEIWWITVQTN